MDVTDRSSVVLMAGVLLFCDVLKENSSTSLPPSMQFETRIGISLLARLNVLKLMLPCSAG
jgi:hypothetical protein